jgi:hypothetical protein
VRAEKGKETFRAYGMPLYSNQLHKNAVLGVFHWNRTCRGIVGDDTRRTVVHAPTLLPEVANNVLQMHKQIVGVQAGFPF